MKNAKSINRLQESSSILRISPARLKRGIMVAMLALLGLCGAMQHAGAQTTPWWWFDFLKPIIRLTDSSQSQMFNLVVGGGVTTVIDNRGCDVEPAHAILASDIAQLPATRLGFANKTAGSIAEPCFSETGYAVAQSISKRRKFAGGLSKDSTC
jgi:hypothetical protein